ncbi:MAG: chromosome partitioning protein ParB, partial [Gemmatimonadales bacterium]
MAEPKTAKRAPSKSEGKPRRKKQAAAEPRSRGIAPDAIGSGTPPAAVSRLVEAIEAEGGSVLDPYKDPLGGHWQIFAAL